MGSRHLVVIYASSEKKKHVVTIYFASDVDGLIKRKVKRDVWRTRS